MSNISNTALSGMNAATATLESVSNNLANSATNGFKAGEQSFSAVFVESGTGSQGAGVMENDLKYNMSGGSLTTSASDTSLAIGGEGFFTVQGEDGEEYYTRDGEFSFDADGNLLTNEGLKVLGLDESGASVPVVLDRSSMAPTASTTVDLEVNLGDTADTLSNSMQIVDSLGTTHDLLTTFSNRTYDSTTGEATWDVTYEINGETIAGQQLVFDQNGQLLPNSGGLTDSIETLDLTSLSAAAKPVGIDSLDLSFLSSTGYSGDSFTRSSDTDGFAQGEFSGYEIDDDGGVYTSYTNGETQLVGTISVTTFANLDGLEQESGNKFSYTRDAGAVTTGTSGENGLGTINAGFLEASNVDTGAELVEMIAAQQMYQANSKSITTDKEINQTLTNM